MDPGFGNLAAEALVTSIIVSVALLSLNMFETLVLLNINATGYLGIPANAGAVLSDISVWSQSTVKWGSMNNAAGI